MYQVSGPAVAIPWDSRFDAWHRDLCDSAV
ncbi:hypothetical protein EC9_52920 [Rosistilla ulvae]|uniref:Uncharacterized protein n=1 Tax=Rosistilla ulvae TaxID=1930277 RepID=A0A517M864_9BACT|nr:hypothetical protein EC9_52920 [Rosistilla ulvae]